MHESVPYHENTAAVQIMQLGHNDATMTGGPLPRVFVADHLDRDLLPGSVPCASDPVLVHPRLKFTHPTMAELEKQVENERVGVKNVRVCSALP